MSLDVYVDGIAQIADGTAPLVQQPVSYDQELEALAALAGAEEPRPPEDPPEADRQRPSPKRHLAEVGTEDDGSPLSQFARRFSRPGDTSDLFWWRQHIESFGVTNASHPSLGPCVDVPYYGRDKSGETVVRANPRFSLPTRIRQVA